MPELEEVLDRVTDDVLGTMFFSAVVGPGEQRHGEDALTAIVEFTGSTRGVLGLSTDPVTATRHTASFLGVDDAEAAPEEVQAVVGELANVICGATLAQCCPDGQFRIAPPRIFSGHAAARRVEEMPVLRRFDLVEGALSLGLSVEDQVADR